MFSDPETFKQSLRTAHQGVGQGRGRDFHIVEVIAWGTLRSGSESLKVLHSLLLSDQSAHKLFFFFFKDLILFIFGCVGSSLLRAGFL